MRYTMSSVPHSILGVGIGLGIGLAWSHFWRKKDVGKPLKDTLSASFPSNTDVLDFTHACAEFSRVLSEEGSEDLTCLRQIRQAVTKLTQDEGKEDEKFTAFKSLWSSCLRECQLLNHPLKLPSNINLNGNRLGYIEKVQAVLWKAIRNQQISNRQSISLAGPKGVGKSLMHQICAVVSSALSANLIIVLIDFSEVPITRPSTALAHALNTRFRKEVISLTAPFSQVYGACRNLYPMFFLDELQTVFEKRDLDTWQQIAKIPSLSINMAPFGSLTSSSHYFHQLVSRPTSLLPPDQQQYFFPSLNVNRYKFHDLRGIQTAQELEAYWAGFDRGQLTKLDQQRVMYLSGGSWGAVSACLDMNALSLQNVKTPTNQAELHVACLLALRYLSKAFDPPLRPTESKDSTEFSVENLVRDVSRASAVAIQTFRHRLFEQIDLFRPPFLSHAEVSDALASFASQVPSEVLPALELFCANLVEGDLMNERDGRFFFTFPCVIERLPAAEIARTIASLSDSKSDLLNQIALRIAKRRVIFVVGAGVSIASASPPECLSWKGLLNHGHKYCQQRNLLSSEALVQLRHLIDSAQFVEAGDLLQTSLTEPHFSDWIRTAFSHVTVFNPALPLLLSQFNCRMMTTNYDSVLSDADSRRSYFTLANGPDPLLQFMRDDKHLPIFHLHGHHSDPAHIVLGTNSYMVVTSNPLMIAARNALSASTSFFFVGFGAGIDDPHFNALWTSLKDLWGPQFAISEHFQLVCGVSKAAEALPRQLSYGSSYNDLVPWIRLLRQRVDHLRLLCDVQIY